MNIKFKKWDCYPAFAKYGNGRTAIFLRENKTHQQIAVATVNVPDFQLNDDEVFIKNYSENNGMLDSLIVAGIIDHPILTIPIGHAEAYQCKLLIEISDDGQYINK